MTREEVFLPGATIGVMGGGQLGRMFAIAARRMGYRVHIFSPEDNGPAAQLADFSTVACYEDKEAVTQFARAVDVITFEFENIPRETVEWVSRERLRRPRGEIMVIVQNRLREKEFLQGGGFPIAPFRRVTDGASFRNALKAIGRPAILKSAAFGYDGKGQQRIDKNTQLDTVWASRGEEECVLEGVIDFEKEISVIVARGLNGATAVFPVCENFHRHHILDATLGPAQIDEQVARAARELAREIAVKLELIGLLAVEMFLTPAGNLIVNELAPRPHNSGHWTIEGCVTSQFEQHVRAVCGLPLGQTTLLRPTAMVNLLGDAWSQGEPNWSSALAEPNVHLHLYGKAEPRLRRKMGHLPAVGDTIALAAASVLRARQRLAPSENRDRVGARA